MKRAAWIPAVVVAGMVFLFVIAGCAPSGLPSLPQSRSDSPPAPLASEPRQAKEPSAAASEPGTSSLYGPPPLEIPLESDTVSSSVSQKTAYLTFDDGPSANTGRILDVLRQYGVKATFFVVGVPSDHGRMLYKRIADEGHALGNHTFTHSYKVVYKSVDAFKLDVEKLSRLLEQSTGKRPDIMRFPGGSNNHQSRKFGGPRIMGAVAAEMKREGYSYFDWNVSSTDAASVVQPKQEIVGAVLGAAKNKPNVIVLMHDADAKKTTVQALPDVIRGLRDMGFRFDVLRKDSFTFQFLKP